MRFQRLRSKLRMEKIIWHVNVPKDKHFCGGICACLKGLKNSCRERSFSIVISIKRHPTRASGSTPSSILLISQYFTIVGAKIRKNYIMKFLIFDTFSAFNVKMYTKCHDYHLFRPPVSLDILHIYSQ